MSSGRAWTATSTRIAERWPPPPTADQPSSPSASGKERDEHGHHREPDQRVRAQRRQDREAGDAGHRADDVDGVRLERRHALEQRAERQGQRGHHRRDQDDHEWQDQEVDVGRSRSRRGRRRARSGRLDLDVELGDDDERHDRAAAATRRATAAAASPLRPSRMPRPMPRKLAISRKLLKKPMYRTFAGIQRMSSSSTNRSVALVRKSRTRGSARPSTRKRTRGPKPIRPCPR